MRVGHIHRRQEITERLAYVGSLDRFTFTDEGQPKGFSLLEWDDDAKGFTDTLVETDARQFATLAVGDDLDDVPEGALVRVVLEPGQSASEVDRDALEGAGLHLVTVTAAARSEPDAPAPRPWPASPRSTPPSCSTNGQDAKTSQETTSMTSKTQHKTSSAGADQATVGADEAVAELAEVLGYDPETDQWAESPETG